MEKCDICNWSGEYVKSPWGNHPQVMCPNCGSLPRHRDAYEFLKTIPDDKNKICLGFTVERCIQTILSRKFIFRNVNFPSVDMTKINKEDESIDIIYACHVLEHIQDDKLAIKEIHRVLKSDGFAILLFPFKSQYETKEEAKEISKGSIHYREYGYDIIKKFLLNKFKRIDVVHALRYYEKRLGYGTVWVAYK